MSDPKPTGSALRTAMIERIVNSRGPINRLRARNWGLDLLLRQPPTLELYYEPGDPHSHLCARLLQGFQQRLRVPLKIRLVGQGSDELYVEPERQRDYALRDAQRIAPAYGHSFDASWAIPPAEQRLLAARALAPCCHAQPMLEREADIAPMLFAGDTDQLRERAAAGAMVPNAQLLLRANSLRRQALGHYLPAMWQFDGQWFWALDRLEALEAALREADALEGDEPLATMDAAAVTLPKVAADAPLEFFFSFRSPYSYLAVETLSPAMQAADLRVRPVLPMAMRGFKIPRAKRFYIVRDVKREADRLGLPFGRIADPIGEGALRCLRVFPLAEGLEQQLAFLREAARAVWTRATDVATDAGMRAVCDAAGISWDAARARLGPDTDISYAEDNRKALFEAGLWGVPSFRLGALCTWGRDRMWLIDEALRRRG